MKQSILLTIGFLLMSTIIIGQKRDYSVVEAELDTARGIQRIRLLNELANQDIYNDQALARRRAWEMIDSAKVYNHQTLMGWGYRYVGLSFDFGGELDSARYYYLKCLPFFDKPKDHGWSYFNIAYTFDTQSKLDSVQKYLVIAEDLFEQDSTALGELGSVVEMKGTVAAKKGDKALALQYYLEASDYYEKDGDMRRMANAIQQVGDVYHAQGEYRKAIETQLNAAKSCRENNEAYYECHAIYALGNSYSALGKADSSNYYYNAALDMSRAVNNDEVTGSVLGQFAVMNADAGKVSLARQQFTESNDIYQKIDDTYSLVFNKERQARMEFNLNNQNQVLQLTREGIALAETQDLFELKSNLLNWQSQSLEKTGNHRDALTSFKSYQSIKDSLNSKDRSDKLQELLVEYETEKKEKELVIAQAEIDRKTARNKLLLVGLVGLGVVASLIIYMQLMRRRKDELLFLKEKEIETELRRNAEQELEFKKKELVAKTLQLARKNEFLSTLEEEVGALKTTVDTGVRESSRKIQRMIQHDANDDDDWEHFAKEFSSIHQGFIDRLSEKHGSFSTNDLRLISLMKMNLSSKDIASTLRISADGIKKARYRLRKKMGLESSVDIQDYLLNYG